MNKLIKKGEVVEKIHRIRGVQVMLDSDLAKIYGVETRVFNQAVKRNIDRFPDEFRFQLSKEEYESLESHALTVNEESKSKPQKGTPSLRSQSVILEADRRGQHRKYLPYVFTEQGVAMLSAILRSETAIKVSIQIMHAFVDMRRFMLSNADMFKRMDSLEQKQLKTDEKVSAVLDAIGGQELEQKQGVFFDGQIFDAYSFISKLIRKAKTSIVLIDNYVDDSVLTLLTKRRENIAVKIYCKRITKQLSLDLEKHNAQHPPIELFSFDAAHDRFLILDNTTVYHIGASLKDLGKKWFAFSKIEKDALQVIEQLEQNQVNK